MPLIACWCTVLLMCYLIWKRQRKVEYDERVQVFLPDNRFFLNIFFPNNAFSLFLFSLVNSIENSQLIHKFIIHNSQFTTIVTFFKMLINSVHFTIFLMILFFWIYTFNKFFCTSLFCYSHFFDSLYWNDFVTFFIRGFDIRNFHSNIQTLFKPAFCYTRIAQPFILDLQMFDKL